MQRLLDDVRALDQMIRGDLFETGVTRIGAEQELFLVDSVHRPAPRSMELLERLDDPHFTTELARFNLEFNLDPLELTSDCLTRLHEDLETYLGMARTKAREMGIDVLMTGILPTLEKADMTLENMTPNPRYFALNQITRELRGGDFRLHIKGQDELSLRHESVMLEACNTSFQIHLQVSAQDFARVYNAGQLAAAPVLAAAVGSPLLFGRRLWHETRIALFQQSVDTRKASSHRRVQYPRVSFGEQWLDDSVIEIFQEDIARFRLLLTGEMGDDPLELLARGEIPDLKALRMHNGTVYRWNRPCFGVADGVAHLRIENRMLPAGPSAIDEVANAAFWFGLVKGLADDLVDVRRSMDFDRVRKSFQSVARNGLDSQVYWLDGKVRPARELILEELLLRARDGLDALGISAHDRDRYLGVVEERVDTGRTTSRWLLDSLVSMNGDGTTSERLVQLTASLKRHQEEGEPVHSWPLARSRESDAWQHSYHRVANLMTTDLFTVDPDDVVDLAASLMDWRHIRHVPVEDSEHRLVGLVTHRTLMRVLSQSLGRERRPIAVHEVMQRDLITVGPETPTLEAVSIMREHGIACLPVVERGRLVGILTERDFMKIAKQLLEDFLRRGSAETEPPRADASPRESSADGSGAAGPVVGSTST